MPLFLVVTSDALPQALLLAKTKETRSFPGWNWAVACLVSATCKVRMHVIWVVHHGACSAHVVIYRA